MKLKFDDDDSLLIWLYIEISELFLQSELPLYTMRFSPNSTAFFTDAELFTCGLFAELSIGKNKKAGYKYLKKFYHHWFPTLPSYEVYNRKLNKYYEAVGYIFKALRKKYGQVNQALAMIDTAPIQVCQAQHSSNAKAAQPFVSKGYCATKKMYYVGAKLQVLAQGRKNKLPFPMEFALATAASHDLNIAKETLPETDLQNLTLYADKAYIDHEFQLDLFETKAINLITPIKKAKGQKNLTLFQQTTNSIHSSLRQPIETLFGWIQQKTAIENASKVRSPNGLFYHVSIKMLAALLFLIVEC